MKDIPFMMPTAQVLANVVDRLNNLHVGSAEGRKEVEAML